ncbi:DUF5392 family protein [Radiobacillus deserti]|uniref:DUF5392 family protein n=1 Tax=Radiobacillus deserti TaxID=2594883 RepID=A0A516KK69_9BACI|nr:DUF5392 family protein [Radiobacillus deserti]QDP41772.1 hypothetical protein FN924_17290 [Radiobacillus deserti]
MNPMMFQKMPHYIQREMEAISEKIRPLMKKSSLYTSIAFPMIIVSIINIFVLLFTNGLSNGLSISLIIFALMAAVGMALSKESKFLRKEIQKQSNQHILKRIEQSEVVPESTKNKFIQMVKQQPVLGFHTFVTFLEEEEKER